MINGVNLNPNIVPSAQIKPQARASEPSFVGNHEMSPEVSSAYRAYGQAILSTKPVNCKTIKTDCGRMVYKNNRLCREFIENANGSISSTINYYYNDDEIPQGNLTIDGMTHYTSPKEYLKYLKDNQIKYEIKKDTKINGISIIEFSNDGEIQTTEWSGNGNPTRHILNSKGQEIQTMTFEKDKTIVENYFTRQKIRNIDAKTVSQEEFTKERINNSTKFNDYLHYLQQNNKQYKIVKGPYSSDVEIIEMSPRGNKKQRTLWTTAKGEFVPIRTYYDKDGNITKNIVFYRDTTQLEYTDFENVQK